MLRWFRQNTTNLTDDELVKRYQETGDMSLLGHLYERYVELVYGVCLKYLKGTVLAEDAVMNIFEGLVEKVKTHEIRQFRPWLHVVAKNHCLMQLRKKNLTISFDEMLPAAQAEVVQMAGMTHPIDEFEPNGDEHALKICLDKLVGHQRKCIEAFYFAGKSYKDIAEENGEEVGRVRSSIQNGRRNLRICMEKAARQANDQQ